MRAAMCEAERLYHVWDSAEGGHPDYLCSPDMKRTYLRRLRLLIGREAYLRAELPRPVPTRYFHELKR